MIWLQQLIDVLSKQDVQNRAFGAKDSNTCKICGGPAITFKSRFTEMEYKISAICEKCQEYYYLND